MWKAMSSTRCVSNSSKVGEAFMWGTTGLYHWFLTAQKKALVTVTLSRCLFLGNDVFWWHYYITKIPLKTCVDHTLESEYRSDNIFELEISNRLLSMKYYGMSCSPVRIQVFGYLNVVGRGRTKAALARWVLYFPQDFLPQRVACCSQNAPQ